MFAPCLLERVDTANGRYYKRSLGDDNFYYPSVTTCLSDYYGKEWLEEWKERVGEERAKQVQTQASIRGTAMHDIYEKWLKGEDYKKGQMPFNLMQFSEMKRLLEPHIEIVYGTEMFLFSDQLRSAGACDTLLRYKGKPTVGDFKTSKRPKEEKDIESYFIQATAYSIMIQERFGFPVEQIMIAMTIDHEHPKIFIKDVKEYYDLTFEVFKKARPCLTESQMSSLLSV